MERKVDGVVFRVDFRSHLQRNAQVEIRPVLRFHDRRGALPGLHIEVLRVAVGFGHADDGLGTALGGYFRCRQHIGRTVVLHGLDHQIDIPVAHHHGGGGSAQQPGKTACTRQECLCAVAQNAQQTLPGAAIGRSSASNPVFEDGHSGIRIRAPRCIPRIHLEAGHLSAAVNVPVETKLFEGAFVELDEFRFDLNLLGASQSGFFLEVGQNGFDPLDVARRILYIEFVEAGLIGCHRPLGEVDDRKETGHIGRFRIGTGGRGGIPKQILGTGIGTAGRRLKLLPDLGDNLVGFCHHLRSGHKASGHDGYGIGLYLQLEGAHSRNQPQRVVEADVGDTQREIHILCGIHPEKQNIHPFARGIRRTASCGEEKHDVLDAGILEVKKRDVDRLQASLHPANRSFIRLLGGILWGIHRSECFGGRTPGFLNLGKSQSAGGGLLGTFFG